MSLDIVLINEVTRDQFFETNITHNLKDMANAAMLYDVMWRPDGINVAYAGEAIPYLVNGIAMLEADPAKYKGFEPLNGWGTYEQLLLTAKEYLEACKRYPNAEINVSR